MIARAVFRNSWRVRWGSKFVMRYFELPMVRRALERLMCDLRNLLRLRKYVAVYSYRDMGAWLAEFEASIAYTGGQVSEHVVLPCGLVDLTMGQYVQVAPRGPYTTKRILQFQARNEELDSVYRFDVYDTGACFYDVTNAMRSETVAKGPRGAMPFDAFMAATTSNMIRPVSPFKELYERRSLLKEAEAYQYNAATAAAFPLVYMTAANIPEEPVEDVADEVIMTAKSLNEARTNGRTIQSMKFSLPHAISLAKSITTAMSAATGRNISMENVGSTGLRNADETVRKALLDAFGRVDPSENIVPIPDFVTMNSTHQPQVLIDVQQRQLEYEIAVCRCMDVPHSFYRTEVETARSSGANNIALGESIIADAVASEQRVYADLFEWLYMTVFGPLDRQFFKSVAADVDALTDAAMDEPDMRRVLQFLTEVTERGGSYAKLEFELLTATNAESLKAMIEAQQLGLVHRQLVERNAQRLFGHTLGKDGDDYALRSDPALRTNFNAPLLPPVDPDTKAKLDVTKQVAKDKAKEPAAKKQKTTHT